MTEALESRRCVPCEGGTPPLSREVAADLLSELKGWQLEDGRLVRTYTFVDFREAVAFVNRITEIAEEEGHHPDLQVGWGRVKVSLSTHAIGGLSDNDFILAAKIDAGERRRAAAAGSG